MRKNRFFVICFLICIIGMLSGCGVVETVQLTEQQSAQVAEYAAGLLLKDASNYTTRLVDTEVAIAELTEARIKQESLAEKVAAMKAAEQKKQEELKKEEDDKKEEQTGEAVDVAPEYSFGDIVGNQNLSLQFIDYLLVDSYPDNSEDGFVFAMDATDGNKLLVMQYELSNTGDEDAEVDFISSGIRFKINVNNTKVQNALSTLLLNDMVMYKGTIPAGSSENVVLVIEVPETEAEALQFLELIIQNIGANQKTRIKLL